LLTKDGKEITFEINGDVLRKEDGTPFGIVHVCRDITERKRTERVLRENDERLRGITQNLPGIIFQFYAKDDGEYGLSYISEPLDEFSKIIVGEDAANLDTFFSSFVSRVYEEDRDRFLVSIKTAVETVTPWNFEGRIALQSGMMVWFQGLSIPTRYEDQLVFDGILLNITERKLAEDELKLFAENLEDANIALRVLMNRRDKDQKEFEEKLQVNINDLVIPSLKKLKMGNLDDRNKNYVSVLEKNLSDILSPFKRDIRSSHKNLTPQEIQIVDLIRQGKNTKEIADMLNASVNTIATHRDNIRKKMNLINSKINLRSHILSLK
jgi:DNA-binding CsgD family transcriptional regulator/PAS domain-containing protein